MRLRSLWKQRYQRARPGVPLLSLDQHTGRNSALDRPRDAASCARRALVRLAERSSHYFW
jgi:hypothetical protein